MDDERDQTSRQLLFLEELIDQHARVAGDIIAIDTQTWAIHGIARRLLWDDLGRCRRSSTVVVTPWSRNQHHRTTPDVTMETGGVRKS
jgi:hypothetical protein